MKLQGQILGVFRDITTGEVTRTFESTNHIQDHFLKDLSGTGSIAQFQEIGGGTPTLFISDTQPNKQRRDWSEDIPNVRGGSDIAGVDRVTVEYDYAPGIHLCTYVQRFGAPAQDYTINIAGVCQNIVSITTANQADTVVWLESPCIQTTTETLDLYYRIQLLYEDDWTVFDSNNFTVNPYDAKILAGFLFEGTPSYPLPTSMNPFGFGFSKYNVRKLEEPNTSLITSTEYQVGGTGSSTALVDGSAYFVRRATFSRDIQTAVGKLIGAIGTYTIGKVALLQKMVPAGFSPIQSVFGHRSTSLTPFYNASESQFGLGTLTIDGAAWTNPDFPKYYRMDITTTGNIGVGAYQFRIRNHFGFKDNTFANNTCPLYFTQANQSHWYNDGFVWARDTGPEVFTTNGAEVLDRTAGSYVHPIDADNVFVVWKNEFAVVNIHTGIGTAVTNTTLVGLDVVPNFLASDISQVAVAANGDYYISCRNTGLYHLNAAMDTLVVINSSTTGLTGVTGCKAVCVGQAGRLWTYWDHATTPTIYYSDDGGSSWTSAGYSDVFVNANPNTVFNIQADPNNAAGKVALLHYDADTGIGDTQQSIFLKWWDHGITTASDFGQIKTIIRTQANYSCLPFAYLTNFNLMHFVQCSPTDSTWGCVGYAGVGPFSDFGQAAFFTFGTATVSAVAGAEDIGTYSVVTQFVPDAAGNDAIIYISDKGQCNNEAINGSFTCLVSSNLTYEALDSTEAGTNGFDGQWPLCYLHDGVWLCYRGYTGDAISYNTRNCYFLYAGIPDTVDFDTQVGLTNELYPKYGWNGLAWEKGHAGSKTLHAAAEELIDGVTVAWNDTGGTTPFQNTDHYTFGVFDGIWLDGSTQFDFRWDLFAKPSTAGTEIEAATLPAVTKVSNSFIIEPPDSIVNFVDTVSVTISSPGQLSATGTATVGDYNAGTRSSTVAIDGTAQSYLPNQTFIPGTDTNNCQGYIEFGIYHTSGAHLEAYYGVSPASVKGTALNFNTIQNALHFDSVTPGNGTGTCTIRVVENGVERAVTTGHPYDTSMSLQGRIALLTNGSMQYEYKSNNTGAWLVLYTSPPGTVTIENLYFDCNIVPSSTYGIRNWTFNYLDTSNPNYYLYLGDGIDKGVFHPTFRSIDPDSVTVLINGVEAVHIGIDDTVTVLPANSYSIYPMGGVIRYSVNDVGKTVSAEYITVHDE